MFQYLAMSYKDSDYTSTIMIALKCWPKHMILVLKLTLVVELWVLFSSHQLPLLEYPASRYVCSSALRKGLVSF